MTELQTILKDTLARWELDTQNRLNAQDQQISQLQETMRRWQTQQTLWEQRLQGLSSLCGNLENLLQRLSNTVSGK